jgi:hypothetical protein
MKWIKWALIALATGLAMVVAAAGAGLFVAENHVASSRASSAASPEAVWCHHRLSDQGPVEARISSAKNVLLSKRAIRAGSVPARRCAQKNRVLTQIL